jgi:DNA repair ATPase RecN
LKESVVQETGAPGEERVLEDPVIGGPVVERAVADELAVEETMVEEAVANRVQVEDAVAEKAEVEVDTTANPSQLKANDKIDQSIRKLESREDSVEQLKKELDKHFATLDEQLEDFRKLNNPRFTKSVAENMFEPDFLKIGSQLTQRLTRAE